MSESPEWELTESEAEAVDKAFENRNPPKIPAKQLPARTPMYAVNHWGSKPGENDDCWDGTDYPTLSEAEAAFNGGHPHTAAWIELDGPGVHKERPNPDYRPSPDTDDDWRRECQREDAMLHGVEGWNAYEGM